MEMLIMLIGMVVGYLLMYGGKKAISYHKKKQLEKPRKKLEATRDEYGYLEEYDAHATRKLEQAEEISGKLTQCDDVTCAICYWKPRNKVPTDSTFSPAVKHAFRLNSFIDSLPDNLSDEEYEEKTAAYKKAAKAGVEKAKQIEADKKAKKELESREDYYATPNHLIDQYLAEGRVFNKEGNYWSNPQDVVLPKDLGQTESMPERVRRLTRDTGSTHQNDMPGPLKPVTSISDAELTDFISVVKRQGTIQELKYTTKVLRETNIELIAAKLKNDAERIKEMDAEMKHWLEKVDKLKRSMKELELRVRSHK